MEKNVNFAPLKLKTMNINLIAPGVSYVGVDDRRKILFENLWPIPRGVSYNSYLVEGTEATALIDSVEVTEIGDLVKHISQNSASGALHYLVVNHMEPDHSGGIPELLRIYPELKIVGNNKTLEMCQGFYGVPADRMMEIKDGQILDLGGKTLQFFMTPMVHWPETMMTWLEADGILFSGDAFGGFGALNGNPLDENQDVSPFFEEIYRYYACIVAKYGRFVQNALKKVGNLSITTICPTHCLIWRKHLKEVVDLYSRLSSWTPEKGTVIVYGTMYGNTSSMAEYLGNKVAELTGAPVKIHAASYETMADILADCVRYENIIIGTPTYSMELFPVIEALMRALTVREIKNKKLCVFSSYTWAPGAAMRRFDYYAEQMKIPILARAEMRQHSLDDCKQQLDAIAQALV